MWSEQEFDLRLTSRDSSRSLIMKSERDCEVNTNTALQKDTTGKTCLFFQTDAKQIFKIHFKLFISLHFIYLHL